MPEIHLFTEFALLVAVAAAMALLMRVLRQPLIIGHVITGLLAGPLLFDLVKSTETLALFSEIGIAFLLFTVGINLSPQIIRQFGKVAVLTGAGQVLITSLAGYLVGLALGFSSVASVYLGIALAFSSTIIIMKLISDKGELESLYAKVSIGFLLVQDIIAVILLFIIPVLSSEGGSARDIVSVLGLGIVSTIAVFAVSFYVLPRLSKFISRSPEMLFLFANAWGIGIAALFRYVGLSLETGALVAGIALSTLPFRHEASARLAPLRDFFIVLFFIFLGSQMVLADIGALIVPAIIFSILVLVGNPIILMAIMGSLGYRKKTSFDTGLTVAQISEFSLILVALGVKFGHVPQNVLSLATFVALITIFISTYLITNSNKIYRATSSLLAVFERKNPLKTKVTAESYPYILFGANRIGYDFVNVFQDMKKSFLVVDYDPKVVEELAGQGIPVEYGDAGDLDFLESLNLDSAELVVSTIPDKEINLLIIGILKKAGREGVSMVVAHQIPDALELYRAGAGYVIMPHFLGGQYAASIVSRVGRKFKDFSDIRDAHLKYLALRASAGHEHPMPERFR